MKTTAGYTLKVSKKARAMRVSVFADGTVLVVAPQFAPLRAVEDFIAKHMPWILAKQERARSRSVIRIAKKEIDALKAQALQFAEVRTKHFAAIYGFGYGKISIRAQKTRWGSCSAKGNLSFNYKIAVLPPAIADYIIVHELCHIGAFDHSQHFWKLVEKMVPNHQALRTELKNTVFMFT